MGMEPIRYETRHTSVCAAQGHSRVCGFDAFYRASGPDFYWNLITWNNRWVKATLSRKAYDDNIHNNGGSRTWIIQ
jgi:hypothetical protein